MGARWQTFMRQESSHHGSKTADMIEARKLSLQEQAVNHDLCKKDAIMVLRWQYD
jgi:hypothetical protein